MTVAWADVGDLAGERLTWATRALLLFVMAIGQQTQA